MRLKATLFTVLLALLVSACGSSTPTIVPTIALPAEPTNTMAPAAAPTNTLVPSAIPTETPATSGDPVWDQIKTSGKIVFGTSADYPPFESYNENDEIIGFDPALARSLGERLGLQVEIVDFAFEGLPAALQAGQIQAAIAAISVTPERQAVMDFTNVYYSGQDMILARQGSQISTIVAPAQLAQYRVGTQRGSIYASWVQNTLVSTGLMPETHLLRYEKASDAVRDLKENRNDLVILDMLAADEYILAGGVVPVGQSLNRQLLAIAVPKGSSVLLEQLNSALTSLQNDGTTARLAETYLDIKLPATAPTPLPSATRLPGPTATPAGCYDSMEFVSDVQVPDGTVMQPGQDFDKVWRIRNTGNCAWGGDYRLVFVQGDRMGGNNEAIRTTVRPGETYDMIIDQKAPNEPGKYTGVWQMVNRNGTPFGARIWVKITVPGAVAPTAVPPTATPVPPVQPTTPPGPVIDYLTASAGTVQQGELLVVSWSFSGTNLASARLTRTNPDGTQTPLYGGVDVEPQGQYEDLMMTPGSYTYTLTVSAEFGGTTVRTVVVNVNSN